MKLELTDTMEKELLIEGLPRAKGFEDAVITISDTAVNVIVKQKGSDKAAAGSPGAGDCAQRSGGYKRREC